MTCLCIKNAARKRHPSVLDLLPCDYLNRHIENLRDLEDRIDMTTGTSCKVMSRTCLAPACHEFLRTAGKACSHIRISEGKDLSILVHTLCHDELEVTITILCYCKICDRSEVWIELGKRTG